MGFLGKIAGSYQSRISLDLAMLFSVFLLPWWFSGILVLAGIFLFPFYWEAILFALMFDLLYSSGNYPSAIPWGLLGVLIVFLSYQFFFKKRLRWFNK